MPRLDLVEVPTLEDIQLERARRTLAEFVRQAWPIVEPGMELIWNWHIDAICEHLEAVTRGNIRNLLINIPPGHCKSLLVSVFWPAWQWVHRPEWRALFGSYAMDLSLRDSVRCRDLVLSDWYRKLAPHVELKSDQNVKGFYENTAKGFRLAIAVGGRATGFRGDAIVVDDPLNAKDAHSEAALNEHVYWFDRVLSTRLNDPRAGVKVVIVQRLHERDLAGHLLDQGGWEHLCLPSEFETERRSTTCLGWQDPRAQQGELLFPELFPATVLDELKHSLANDYAGQHQQRPAPADGGILKSWWWRFWFFPGHEPPPVTVRIPDGGLHNCIQEPLPEILHQQIQSWDMAFKDTKASAYVVGQTWGLKDANAFLLDQIRDKLDITASLDAVRTLSAKWPKGSAKLIEDKANGPAVIRMLRDEIPGILEVQPDGGKEARANSVAPYIRSGNVYLPHPSACPWVNALLDETTTFPNSRYADQVDALSQALINLFQSGGSLTLRKMVTL